MRVRAGLAHLSIAPCSPAGAAPQTFLVKDGGAQMQLHAGDRYQLQPGAQLRFGALPCCVQFSHQPVPASEEDDRGPADQPPAAAVDPDATQVPSCKPS